MAELPGKALAQSLIAQSREETRQTPMEGVIQAADEGSLSDEQPHPDGHGHHGGHGARRAVGRAVPAAEQPEPAATRLPRSGRSWCGAWQTPESRGLRHGRCLPGLCRYAPMRWPVVVDCDNPCRLYAGTSKGGMFRSDNAAQSWREINQGIIYKEIWSLVQHPRTGELYVGTGPASVFKSLDRGESWRLRLASERRMELADP